MTKTKKVSSILIKKRKYIKNKTSKIYKLNKSKVSGKSDRQGLSILSILSYNISWESMSGSVSKWALCNNNTNTNNPRHSSVCVNNISSVFDSDDDDDGELDFITLQEATDYNKLIKESDRLKQMKFEVHKSGLDTIVTFWDSKKFKLKKKILGEFENGRPWMATMFDYVKKSSKHNNIAYDLCLINIHMGHYDKDEEFQKLEKMMLDINKNNNDNNDNDNTNTNIIAKRYIISGDFNYDIKKFGNGNGNNFTLNNTKFYFHPKHILTCCINRRKHNDHVIDSLEQPLDITIPKVSYMASDHKPIMVRVTI